MRNNGNGDVLMRCSVIPPTPVTDEEREKILRDIMKFADGPCRKDIEKAIENGGHKEKR